jgi:hypothetical protein
MGGMPVLYAWVHYWNGGRYHSWWTYESTPETEFMLLIYTNPVTTHLIYGLKTSNSLLVLFGT